MIVLLLFSESSNLTPKRDSVHECKFLQHASRSKPQFLRLRCIAKLSLTPIMVKCKKSYRAMSKIKDSLLVLGQATESEPGHEDGLLVVPEKPALERPSRYQVVMMNDDYTPMHFVVEVLTTFFTMSEEQATQVMLAVHTQGKAVCGVFTKDVAETKVAQVNQYSAECDHPLLCELQKAD